MISDKYKIIALFGKAGSGKDYIQKKIMETDFGKNNLSEIISCTTRPPREGEIDGVHYHFISAPAQLIKKDLIEYTIFRNWWYGTAIEHLSQNKINIGVFNIDGIKQLLEKNNIEVLPIYIKTLDKIRLIRQLNREKNPDCDEIIRRFLTDKKDFLNIPFHYFVIENNTNEIYSILDELFSIIQSWSIKDNQ